MADNNNNLPQSSDALDRTLNEILASELVLDGRNGQILQSTVEGVVSDLLSDSQFRNKLLGETKVGFGMALGKFLAWKAWTEIEKSDKRKAASKARPNTIVITMPQTHLSDVKRRWPSVKSAFKDRVGFALPEPTLERGDEHWTLGMRGGLIEQRKLDEDWFSPLVDFLVEHSPRLLSLGLVKQLVDGVRQTEPVIGEELERLRLPITIIYRVLESLLQEGVPIHEMETILTAIVLQWDQAPDRQQLLTAVRTALSPWICKSVQSRPGLLRGIRVGQRMEEMFADSLRYIGSEQVFALSSQQKALIVGLIKQAIEKLDTSEGLIIFTNHRIRSELRALLRKELPNIIVMSESEVHRGFQVEIRAVVDFKDAPIFAGDTEADGVLSF